MALIASSRVMVADGEYKLATGTRYKVTRFTPDLKIYGPMPEQVIIHVHTTIGYTPVKSVENMLFVLQMIEVTYGSECLV